MCVRKSNHLLTWVNCDHGSHYFIAGSITLLLRVCVNLLQCNRCSTLRRVCVRISRHFLTLVNCDHCSHYYLAGSITLLLRVYVNLVWCYHYSILRRVCVRISNHFLTLVNCNLLRCVLTWCSVIDIVFPEGCV